MRSLFRCTRIGISQEYNGIAMLMLCWNVLTSISSSFNNYGVAGCVVCWRKCWCTVWTFGGARGQAFPAFLLRVRPVLVFTVGGVGRGVGTTLVVLQLRQITVRVRILIWGIAHTHSKVKLKPLQSIHFSQNITESVSWCAHPKKQE